MTQTRHNLPIPQTSFIGREAALAAISSLLQHTRLLTLTGSGGSGKTRLALQAASGLLAQYPDGVWWVDLASLSDPLLLPQWIAAVLGLRTQAGRSTADQLAGYLQRRSLLLVLDNCEHLRTACATLVSAWLAHNCAARILATSREALGLQDEQTWLVPMLALPEPETALAPDELQNVEAVRLFVERARAVAPAFVLHEGNAGAVAQICRRLDGLPLAIELAAARANVLAPRQIAGRLDHSLHLLTRCAPAHDTRHRTLRAALDWSFDLLSQPEQALFVRLAVFSGSFDLEAVEQVCAGSGLAGEELLDLLASLVEKSLLVASEQCDIMRYRLLEPVRQYAAGRLGATGDEPHWRNRHAACYATLAGRAAPALQGPEQLSWLNRLALDYDNLRAALAWFAGARQVEAGLRLSSALFPFWRVRGYFSEGQRWLETFLQHSEPDAAPGAHIDALNGLARLHLEQSSFTTAQTLYAQSLALARAAAYEQGLEAALVGLGLTRWELGDFPGASTVLAEAIPRCRAAQQLRMLAGALRIRGLVHWSQGDIAAARTCCTESLALSRQTGDGEGVAGSLFNLALLASLQGEYGLARQRYEECLAVNRQLGHQGAVADVLINLGQLAVDQEDFAAGAAFLEEASRIHHRLGDQGDAAYSLASLADIAFYTGQYTQARNYYQEALHLFRTAGNKRMIGRALAWLGAIACRQGDLVQAAALCTEALTLRQTIGHKAGIVFSLEEGFAELALAIHKPAVAVRLLAVAEGLYEEMSRTRTPVEQRRVQALKTAIYAQLGEHEFDLAWNEGQAMSMEQAIAHALDALSPAAVARPHPQLRIYALGPVRFYRGDRLLKPGDWTYARARELVLFLHSHPHATREQIGVEFWPDASTEQVRKRFSAALTHARNTLGRHAAWIILADGGYHLNPAHLCWSDVQEFEKLLRHAQQLLRAGNADEAAELLTQATRLYTGDFAEDLLDAGWTAARRATLRQAYLDALLALGRLHAAAARLEQALRCYQQAAEKEPYLEEAHCEIIRCYTRLHQRGPALRQYERLSLALAELGAAPSPDAQALITRLRHNQPP